MRVLLFDPVLDGHHLEYASCLMQYLMEQGDDPLFVTWQSSPRLDGLPSPASPRVRFVAEQGEPAFGGSLLQRTKQLTRGLVHAFSHATEHGMDIVHHLYADRTEIPLALALRKARNRQWNLFSTLWWPYFVHEKGERIAPTKSLYHRANGRTLRQLLGSGSIDGLFVHSDRIKNRLAMSGFGPSLSRITVVPDPSYPATTPTRNVPRVDLNLPADGPIVLFFGATRWDKGPDLLLEALPLVDDPFVAVIAGEPRAVGMQEVEACRKRLGDSQRLIARLEFIPEEDLDRYFAAADIVILPYRRMFRGTSGVLQRAAAAGTPVIAADVGDVGPTVRKHGLGLTVEPESVQALALGLHTLLQDLERFQKDVESRSLGYAGESDWRILGATVREAYVRSIHSSSV